MSARLVRIAHGVYKVRWRDGTRSFHGRLIERSTGALDKPTALAEVRRIDAEQQQRRDLQRARAGKLMAIETLLKLWGTWALAERIAQPAHIAETSRILGQIAKTRKWTTVVDVTPAAVAAWRAERGGKGTDKPLSLLKSVLRYARNYQRQPVDLEVLAVPGRRGIARRPPPPLLTAGQVRALIDRARAEGGDDAASLVEHLATYGCRPVDACRLRVRDFNAVAGEVTIGASGLGTKSRTRPTHPLTPGHADAYRRLVAGRQNDDPLFASPYAVAPLALPWKVGKSAQQMLDWYVEHVSSYVVPRPQWGLYALKDYAITEMDRRGIDDATKALFTGHRSLAVFARYKTTNRVRAADAVSVMGVEAIRAPSAPEAPQVRPRAHDQLS